MRSRDPVSGPPVKERKLVKMQLIVGGIFQPHQAAELDSFSHMVLDLELRREEKVLKFGSTYNGSLIERPFLEAVKTKLGETKLLEMLELWVNY